MAGRSVLEALDAHIQAEDTGTAMIVFADNSLGRIYLNSGVPTSARYRNLEGMEAVRAFRSVDVKTVKFHADTDIVRSRQLLGSNYEVIESLNQSDPAPAQPAVQQAPAQPAAPAGIPGAPSISPANRQRLGTLLADYIGPVAPLVMTDLPAQVDLETALSILSREIDDTTRASEFVSTARRLVE